MHAKSKVAIGSHPLFPAIVALWFGALFGLGSIAIRPGLIEDAVLAAHIDTLIPAAAPPLGMTTRILLALAMAGLGGLIGGVLARRLSRPKPEKRERRRGAASTQHAVSPRRTYAPPQAEAAPGAGGPQKRRALMVDSEVTPPELRERAPLPGGPLILNIADIDTEQSEDQTGPAAGINARPDSASAQIPQPALTGQADDYSRVAAIAERPFAAPLAELPQAAPCGDEAPPLPVSAWQPSPSPRLFDAAPDSPVPSAFAPAQGSGADAEPAEIGTISPFTRFADYGGDDDADDGDDLTQADLPAPGRLFAAPTEASPFQSGFRDAGAKVANLAASLAAPDTAVSPPKDIFAHPSGSAAERLVNADLDSLSPVELIERLAIRLQRRREAVAAANGAVACAEAAPGAIVPSPHVAPVSDGFARVPPATEIVDHAGEMPGRIAPAAAGIPAVPALPAAMRPLSFDDDGDGADDDAIAAQLPGRLIAAPSRNGADADEPEDVAEALDSGYSSLLDLSLRQANRDSAGKPSFVRIEDPEEDAATGAIEPVVVFPGQAGRSPSPHSGGARHEPAGANAPEAEAQSSDSCEDTASGAPDPGFRPFDSPAAVQQSGRAALRQDSAESERALRSALATLQRMSGAA